MENQKTLEKNIRQYNNAMSFVSFGTKVDLPPNYGPYTFRIRVVHHRISPLYPKDLQSTSYGQLYICHEYSSSVRSRSGNAIKFLLIAVARRHESPR